MPDTTPQHEPTSPLRVALLGCGVVGSQVARGLLANRDDLAERVGVPLHLIGIAVRDVNEVDDPAIPRELLTDDPQALIEAGPDLVIELMGGIEPARSLVLLALGHGASVVTANKALLAAHGPELYEAAAEAGVDLSFEAAVGGAIPIVRPIRESLSGDQVHRVLGIVNGTTNYVLDRMATDGLSLDAAVSEAQRAGYAEADPSADVDGFDAAAKAAILASLAFHTRVALPQVAREGIAEITSDDVAWAARTGHVVKLLAIAERTPDGVIVRAHPALVPSDHPLASVRGAFNAVFVESELAGPLMFYGQGAGGVATSSAVLGDVVVAARRRVLGGGTAGESAYRDLPILPGSSATSRYQIRLVVLDEPGVLAQIATVLARNGVSIETVRQAAAAHSVVGESGVAELVISTHAARERALAETVEELRALGVVESVVSVLRIEGV